MEKMNVVLEETPYAIEEAMNRLRVNIQFIDENIKKLLIVSSIPGEGKSTVSIHLWKLLSESGFKTVLVDADLRKSEFKEKYWTDYQKECKGFNHYLAGQASYEDVLYGTNHENGYIIPVTNVLVNPSNLLQSNKLDVLLDKLVQDFRYIIIDSPPLESVSDGALLASKSDGSILIVQAGKTPKRLIHQSVKELERIQCPLLGVVLNKTQEKKKKYKGYYYTDYYKK